jgi:hypothetical protein
MNMNTKNPYALWFSRFIWLGIIANMFFVIPLLFFPEKLLGLLNMTVPQPVIWARAAGLLLLEISIIYIPGAMHPYRYRQTAWMSVLVMRGGGATFFFAAVVFFGQQFGFISIAVVDTFFGVTQGLLLYRATKTSQLAQINAPAGMRMA